MDPTSLYDVTVNTKSFESVTIATITHQNSFVDFLAFLTELRPAIETFPGDCELLVVQNSGIEYVLQTSEVIKKSRIAEFVTPRVIESPINNIATARNIAIENSKNDLLVFIDDDGFPVPRWLEQLTTTLNEAEAQMVAGPTIPLYLFDTPQWIKTVDLHNSRNKVTGQLIDRSTAGNLMLRRSRLVGNTFNEKFGQSGGEDTEFLTRQIAAGLKLVWCNEAAVYEYIPKNKSTSKYFIKRFIVQGQLFRKVMTETGAISKPAAFIAKSVVMISLAIFIAPILVILRNKYAGIWVKRGFANLGHLSKFSNRLYPSTDEAD